MAISRTSVNQGFAILGGAGNNLVAGTRVAKVAMWLGSTTTPIDTDVDEAHAGASFLTRGVAMDYRWAFWTRKIAGVGSDTKPIGAGVYFYEDDVDGNGGNSANHVSYQELYFSGDPAPANNFPSAGSYQLTASGSGTFTPAKSGSFKVVLVLFYLVGHPALPTQGAVGNGVGDTEEFYIDSDGYAAFSGSAGTDPALKGIDDTSGTNDPAGNVSGKHRAAWCRVQTDPQTLSASIATPHEYGIKPTVTIDANASTFYVTTGANAKGIRVGFVRTANADRTIWTDPATTTAPDKTIPTLTMLANGASSTTGAEDDHIDTDYQQLLTKYRLHAFVGPRGGQASTPTGEKPDILDGEATVTLVDANDQAWTVFASTGLGAGITQRDSYTIQNTSNFDIGHDIVAWKESAGLTAGVGVFATSAYATVEDLWRRPQVTSTSHSKPQLETYLKGAAGNALAKSFLLRIRRPTDSIDESTLTQTSEASGRERWEHVIDATDPAFNRFFETGITRATGSVVATGPDNPGSPPATFTNFARGGSDKGGTHPNPTGSGTLNYDSAAPAYPRSVAIIGNAYAGVKEPTRLVTSVFGINSEIMFEGMWTGDLGQATVNANNEPTGTATRNKNLGTGALRYKISTEMNESTKTLNNVGEFNPCDVAGRLFAVTGSDAMQGRRAAWNVTTSTRHEAPTNDLNSNYFLTGTLGYAPGTGGDDGFQSLVAPSDPGNIAVYYAYSSTAATAQSFDLNSSAPEQAGFNVDGNNFGFFRQVVAFIAVNPNFLIVLTTDRLVAPSGATSVRISARFLEILPDESVTPVLLDSSAKITISKDGGTGNPITEIVGGASMTPINPDVNGKSANWEYLLSSPANATYTASVTGLINGSRPTGPGQVSFVVGVDPEFDGVDFATGFPFY